jgi:hypothetical protein
MASHVTRHADAWPGFIALLEGLHYNAPHHEQELFS